LPGYRHNLYLSFVNKFLITTKPGYFLSKY
jgi:hypothetical protein